MAARSARTVAIIGSGIAAAAIAHRLVQAGLRVTIFEKGPAIPYPHAPQFEERTKYLYRNPDFELPPDLKTITLSGAYRGDIEDERAMVVGGSATHWNAITLRMHPEDFRTRMLFGYGTDWPIAYNDLEPFYSRAEQFLGVSGTDTDNPYAPPRSKPYPLPPFPLDRVDRVFASQLREKGITLHTTPQARTRSSYDGRPACANFGTCRECPIGARYSPNHHLMQAVATGRCNIVANTSVRRILVDRSGRARSIVYQPNHGEAEAERSVDAIVLAAGAVESARLLLLSTSGGHPDGIGNRGGHVGKHLTFHHLSTGTLLYKQPVFAGNLGPLTGQTHHFCNPPGRGRHGGVKVEFSSNFTGWFPLPQRPTSGEEILEAMRRKRDARGLILHGESTPHPAKHVRLSEERDRFGDPFAHIHYEPSEFDHETHRFATSIFEQLRNTTGAEAGTMSAARSFYSGAHHMGTCRMGSSADTSVVDSFGRVHDTANLYVAGSSVFPGTSGSVNPTLTLVALALRTANRLLAA